MKSNPTQARNHILFAMTSTFFAAISPSNIDVAHANNPPENVILCNAWNNATHCGRKAVKIFPKADLVACRGRESRLGLALAQTLAGESGDFAGPLSEFAAASSDASMLYVGPGKSTTQDRWVYVFRDHKNLGQAQKTAMLLIECSNYSGIGCRVTGESSTPSGGGECLPSDQVNDLTLTKDLGYFLVQRAETLIPQLCLQVAQQD